MTRCKGSVAGPYRGCPQSAIHWLSTPKWYSKRLVAKANGYFRVKLALSQEKAAHVEVAQPVGMWPALCYVAPCVAWPYSVPNHLRKNSITNRSASCPQPIRIPASPTRDAPRDVTRGNDAVRSHPRPQRCQGRKKAIVGSHVSQGSDRRVCRWPTRAPPSRAGCRAADAAGP